MTLRELLNEILSLTIADAGLIVSGVLSIGLSLWEWITATPVNEKRLSGLSLLWEKVRVAVYPLGYLILGVVFLAFACV